MTIKNIVKGIGAIALGLTFMYQVAKSHYEPNFSDALIQYKASTVSPQYSGFDLDGNGEIDKINVYRARWLGYQNKDLFSGNQEFEDIKMLLDEELTKNEDKNCFTNESRTFPIRQKLEEKVQ